MKHWLRLALCGGALAALLTCGAAAATDDYTTDVAGTVTYSEENGKYTASYDGAQNGNQYAILVVKGTPESYSISEDTIMYIDQMAADSSGVSFDFIPRSTPDCVVLLGGDFGTTESPVVLGTLVGKGTTLTGEVSLGATRTPGTHNGVQITLTDKSSSTTYTATSDENGDYEITSVPDGTYTLHIEKPGFLQYTKNTVTVDAVNAQLPEVTLVGGDINSSNSIDIQDLSLFLGDFGKNAGDTDSASYSDIDGSGVVIVSDLSIFLANFGDESTVED